MEKITFTASLPAIQSALTLSGNGDGARVKLDIPGTDLSSAMRLMLLAGRAFQVTVEPLPQNEQG